LKKALISGTFLSAILVAARVGEEVARAALSAPEWLWALSPVGLLAMGRSWAVSMAMKWEMGAVQQVVKSWKATEWEAMGLDALINAQLYMHNRWQCDDSLLKKDAFLF
jgi:hypothetical protein